MRSVMRLDERFWYQDPVSQTRLPIAIWHFDLRNEFMTHSWAGKTECLAAYGLNLKRKVFGDLYGTLRNQDSGIWNGRFSC